MATPPAPIFLPGKFHWQRRATGTQESGTTEHARAHTHTHTHTHTIYLVIQVRNLLPISLTPIPQIQSETLQIHIPNILWIHHTSHHKVKASRISRSFPNPVPVIKSRIHRYFVRRALETYYPSSQIHFLLPVINFYFYSKVLIIFYFLWHFIFIESSQFLFWHIISS